MSDQELYLQQTIQSMNEHSQDSGHCQEFRDQCAREIPNLTDQLKQLRSTPLPR